MFAAHSSTPDPAKPDPVHRSLAHRGMDWLSRQILLYLGKPTRRYAPFFAPEIALLRTTLEPCDIVLVEGNTRLSAIIKYLTQSTWSHAAIYVGDALGGSAGSEDPNVLIEAEAEPGVIASPLTKYAHFNTRICRPVGLSAADKRKVLEYVTGHLGMQYDNKQVLDLARYLFPFPPVPVALRRRLLAVGSGDPTRAICSTLIGAAFAAINYPILPDDTWIDGKADGKEEKVHVVSSYVERENNHIRRHGLYTPRDFDVSPYFEVVKPALQSKFDYHKVTRQLRPVSSPKTQAQTTHATSTRLH